MDGSNQMCANAGFVINCVDSNNTGLRSSGIFRNLVPYDRNSSLNGLLVIPKYQRLGRGWDDFIYISANDLITFQAGRLKEWFVDGNKTIAVTRLDGEKKNNIGHSIVDLTKLLLTTSKRFLCKPAWGDLVSDTQDLLYP